MIDEATFQISDAMLDDFKQYATKRGVEFSGKNFEDNRDSMKRSIKYEIYYNRFGAGEARRVLLEGDPQLTKALTLCRKLKISPAKPFGRSHKSSNRQKVRASILVLGWLFSMVDDEILDGSFTSRKLEPKLVWMSVNTLRA